MLTVMVQRSARVRRWTPDAVRATAVAVVAAVSALVAAAGTSPNARAQDRRAGRIELIRHQPSDAIPIPAGLFMMGPSQSELADMLSECEYQLRESAAFCRDDWHGNFALEQRLVYVDAFAIDRYEVTAAAYRRCANAGGCAVDPLIAGDERHIRDDLPIVNITWSEARDYCAWAGKRLPTEAEWEKAARGPEGYRWPWGNRYRVGRSNHGRGESSAMLYTHASTPGTFAIGLRVEFAPDDADGFAAAAPPGSMWWGESPYGVMDMSGNVSEWVQDYFSLSGYGDLPTFNPVRSVPHPQTGDQRVRRGGSWFEPQFFGRTYYRMVSDATDRHPHVGFRCARSLGDRSAASARGLD
jgi:formylglycine-generating enzyme required for sulfatase activity